MCIFMIVVVLKGSPQYSQFNEAIFSIFYLLILSWIISLHKKILKEKTDRFAVRNWRNKKKLEGIQRKKTMKFKTFEPSFIKILAFDILKEKGNEWVSKWVRSRIIKWFVLLEGRVKILNFFFFFFFFWNWDFSINHSSILIKSKNINANLIERFFFQNDWKNTIYYFGNVKVDFQ